MIRWATVTDVTDAGVWIMSGWLPAATGPLPALGNPHPGDPVLVVRTDEGELAVLPPPRRTAPRWRGGNISAWNYGPYANLPLIIDQVAALGLNCVTVPVRVAAVDIHDSTPTVDTAHLAWAQTVAAALPDVAIIAEPYPWVDNGNQSETLWDPDDVAEWFTAWTAACRTVAEAFPQAAMVYIGSNIVSMENAHPDQWAQLVAAVREVTGAELSYRCNWWYEQTRLAGLRSWPLLDLVDVISVAAYFELTDTTSPSYDEIRASLDGSLVWNRNQNIVADVQSLSQAHAGKPVFFGELACAHWYNGLGAPWNPDTGTVRDKMIQQRMFAAYVDAFGRHQWWRGFSVFGVAGFADSGYTLELPAIGYIANLGAS